MGRSRRKPKAEDYSSSEYDDSDDEFEELSYTSPPTRSRRSRYDIESNVGRSRSSSSEASRPQRSHRTTINYRELDDDDEAVFSNLDNKESTPTRQRRRPVHNDFLTENTTTFRTRSRDRQDSDVEGTPTVRRSTRDRKRKDFGEDYTYEGELVESPDAIQREVYTAPPQEQNKRPAKKRVRLTNVTTTEQQVIPNPPLPANTEPSQDLILPPIINTSTNNVTIHPDPIEPEPTINDTQSPVREPLPNLSPIETPQRTKDDDDEYVQNNDEEEEEDEEDEEDEQFNEEEEDDLEDDSPLRRRPIRRRAKRRNLKRRNINSYRKKRNQESNSASSRSSSSDFESEDQSQSQRPTSSIKKRLRPRTDIQLQPYTAPPTLNQQDVNDQHSRHRQSASSSSSSLNSKQLQNAVSRFVANKSNNVSSSSSSSSDYDSDDPGMKNLNKSFSKKDNTKQKNKADIDPIAHDPSIASWDSIGGLENHVEALKEMILLPLLYPSYFDKYKITPPRGVLFYGPPGTGKTLVARALSGACTHNGQPIAFFMRKGADILSKWVGEAEKQLRLLFDRARELQPSIIFFDEIDGLAPVRSSKQDYIHSSIVSTLLALMDGLDSRGQVVVIGATNRIDAIDPALRRPGRFDRELAFTLPNHSSRMKILKIHTKCWNPPLGVDLMDQICRLCVGYCGADIKALTTEAALRALKRSVPQIYTSLSKLNVDFEKVHVTKLDFLYAIQNLTPASHRSAIVHAMPLPNHLSPLLIDSLHQIQKMVICAFPPSIPHLTTISMPISRQSKLDENDDLINLTNCMSDYYLNPPAYRPWILIKGKKKSSSQQYLAQALLYSLEAFPVYSLSLISLLSNVNHKSMEESIVGLISECRKQAPSVLYIPDVDEWFERSNELMRFTLVNLLTSLRSNLPVLVVVTCNHHHDDENLELDQFLKLFDRFVHHVDGEFKKCDLEQMFKVVMDDITRCPLKQQSSTLVEGVEDDRLEIVPTTDQNQIHDFDVNEFKSKLNQMDHSEKSCRKKEKNILMELRLHLRDMMIKITNQNIYQVFAAPRSHNRSDLMYLSDIAKKLEHGNYTLVKSFLKDIKCISQNAEKYVVGYSDADTPVTIDITQQHAQQQPVVNEPGGIDAAGGDDGRQQLDSEPNQNVQNSIRMEHVERRIGNMTNKEYEKRMNVVMRGRQLYEAIQTVSAQIISRDLKRKCKAVTRRRERFLEKRNLLIKDASDHGYDERGEKIVVNAPLPSDNESTVAPTPSDVIVPDSSSTTDDAFVDHSMDVSRPSGDEGVDENQQQDAVMSSTVGENQNDKTEPQEQPDGDGSEENVIVDIDRNRLEIWFQKLIQKCEEMNVESLDEWFSTIYQHIYRYRFNQDRNELLQELEIMLDSIH
ncbi:ATPase family AAA domain-containing protein [Acrasis kona]|uniref:ATPase family AAA domain-containing protein n=1 Tax=Acrasis kona TaxID=1008807 RepID=A0AAW2YY49_9EUKA